MWIDIAHTLGLTNLSDEQVERYKQLVRSRSTSRRNFVDFFENVLSNIQWRLGDFLGDFLEMMNFSKRRWSLLSVLIIAIGFIPINVVSILQGSEDFLRRFAQDELLGVPAPNSLLISALLLFLVALGSAENLFLARWEARQGEIAMRIAVGAHLRRLIWLFISETLRHATGGAIVGFALSFIVVRQLETSQTIIVQAEHLFSQGSLTMLLQLTLATCVFLALPLILFASRIDTFSTLYGGVRKISLDPKRINLRSLVVGSQMVMAVFLCSMANALVRDDTRSALGTLHVALAAVSLFIAAFGVYGITASAVIQRTQEVGLRKALGARRSNLIQMFLGKSFRLAISGAIVGVGVIMFMNFISSTFSEHISLNDASLPLIVMLVIFTSLAATYLPARHAASLDPMTALRYE